jgi:hypothetical protein
MSLRQYLAVLGYRPHFVRAACARRLWSQYRMPWELWREAQLAALTEDDTEIVPERQVAPHPPVVSVQSEGSNDTTTG